MLILIILCLALLYFLNIRPEFLPQERLKIAGATWHPNTINPMLALRVIRANHWWADFWKQIIPELKINENTAFA
ncbi:hypothetical protein [Dendronalium sp. ChiSLP03b]|uniref:hypothetical protein n=1 Tax=Dendronalium sp. ChiSLP03b TaxID=3075381 RepID=UPI002AD5AF73|nr:hypothetical protein [Dendronalium sp. ChiSLP03b]MDZ8208931.1 hypothetical protein [Dendronalium sp. ChiSLP03b]